MWKRAIMNGIRTNRTFFAAGPVLPFFLSRFVHRTPPSLRAESEDEPKSEYFEEEDEEDFDFSRDFTQTRDEALYEDEDAEWDWDEDQWYDEHDIEDDPFSEHAAMAVLLGSLGGITAYLGIRIWDVVYRHKISKKWKRTPGELVTVLRLPSKRTGKPKKKPVIRYKYVVDGKIYSGKRLRWRILPVFSFERSEPKINVDKLKPKRKVWVYYDEKNPRVSCLVPSDTWSIPDSALFGVVGITSLLFSSFTGRRLFFALKKLGS